MNNLNPNCYQFSAPSAAYGALVPQPYVAPSMAPYQGPVPPVPPVPQQYVVPYQPYMVPPPVSQYSWSQSLLLLLLPSLHPYLSSSTTTESLLAGTVQTATERTQSTSGSTATLMAS